MPESYIAPARSNLRITAIGGKVGASQGPQNKTNRPRDSVNRAGPNSDRQTMLADCFHRRRRDAAALMAIGSTTELTRRYHGPEIRRDGSRRECKHATPR